MTALLLLIALLRKKEIDFMKNWPRGSVYAGIGVEITLRVGRFTIIRNFPSDLLIASQDDWKAMLTTDFQRIIDELEFAIDTSPGIDDK